MSARPEEMAARLARELSGRRVWLSQELDPWAEIITSRARRVDRPVDADVAVIRAQAISDHGEILAEGPAFRPASARWIAWLELERGGRILTGARHPHLARAARIYTELGVIDLRAGELVIVELAPGVSARDFQARVEPTLRISPRVDEMRASDDDERDNREMA